MAAINAIAKDWADELRDGIAWVIVWKTGRSWNAAAVWLNSEDDTFEPEDLEQARKILEQDPNAVMLNGYYCGHFGEDMTVAELAAGIRWHWTPRQRFLLNLWNARQTFRQIFRGTARPPAQSRIPTSTTVT